MTYNVKDSEYVFISIYLLKLAVSNSVEEVEASACYAAPPGGGAGNRRDRWTCKEMIRKTRVSLILVPITPFTITSVPYL